MMIYSFLYYTSYFFILGLDKIMETCLICHIHVQMSHRVR